MEELIITILCDLKPSASTFTTQMHPQMRVETLKYIVRLQLYNAKSFYEKTEYRFKDTYSTIPNPTLISNYFLFECIHIPIYFL